MDNDNWRYRIETFGIVGVIASLVFVGLEIRQNTTATKAAAIQEMTASNLVHMDGIAGNSQLAGVLSRGVADIESLTDSEQFQFVLTYNAGLMNTHGLFRQWELGVLPDEDWAHWKARICVEAQLPIFQLVWAELKSFYAPTFVDAIEACDEFSEDLD